MSNQGRGWTILEYTQIYGEGSGGRLRPQLGPGQKPDGEGGKVSRKLMDFRRFDYIHKIVFQSPQLTLYGEYGFS